MAYCSRCGVFAALDDAKMCGTCRRDWRPAGDRPADLGSRAQPQPLGGRGIGLNLDGREEVRAVGNITVGRYDDPASVGYQGWIEPDDRSWIMFVSNDGQPVAFLNRDPETGAVL